MSLRKGGKQSFAASQRHPCCDVKADLYGPSDDRVIAFTPFGVENLRELIEMDRDSTR